VAGVPLVVMTAKQQLQEAVERLSEEEAREALRLLEARVAGDRVLELFESAPADDEPLSEGEEAAIDEGRAAYERGEFVSLEQLHDELA